MFKSLIVLFSGFLLSAQLNAQNPNSPIAPGPTSDSTVEADKTDPRLTNSTNRQGEAVDQSGLSSNEKNANQSIDRESKSWWQFWKRDTNEIRPRATGSSTGSPDDEKNTTNR